MGASVLPQQGPGPNPRMARLRQYADLLREFSGDTSGDPDVRDLLNLARIAYKQESEMLALERSEQSQRERRELSAGPIAALAVGGMEGLGAVAGGAAGAQAGAALGALGGPAAPVTVPVGTIAGGLVGAGLGMKVRLKMWRSLILGSLMRRRKMPPPTWAARPKTCARR